MAKIKQPKTNVQIVVEPINSNESIELEEFGFVPIENSEKQTEIKSGFFYADQPDDSNTTKWAKILTSTLALMFALSGLFTSAFLWVMPYALERDMTIVLVVILILGTALVALIACGAGFVLGALRFRKVIGISAMLVSLLGLVSTGYACYYIWNLLKSMAF